MDLTFLGEFDRIYTYARVSSTEQGDDRRNSIEGQESRLGGISPKPTQHFRDIQGGDDPTRPDFNRLVAQARSDAFKGLKVVIVVTDQSRLSRGEDAARLIASFDDIEVCVYALDDGKLTTKSPNQWFFVATKGVHNHYFVLQIRARLRATNTQKRLEGRPVSRKPPYGYKYTKEKFVLDPDQFKIARECVEKFLPLPLGAGWSLRQCAAHARSLGWDIQHTGFKAWLVNVAIQGHTEYSVGGCNREEAKRGVYSKHKPKELRINTHDPIITLAEYQLIQQQLKDNWRYARTPNNKAREPLSGLIYCGNCGKKLHFATVTDRTSGKKYHNYSCKFELCDHRLSISLLRLEPYIQKRLADRAVEIAQVVDRTELEPKIDTTLIEWERQLKDLRQMYDRDAMAGLRLAIEELERKIAERSETPTPGRSIELLQESIRIFTDPTYFNLLSKPEKRVVYQELIERVTIRRGRELGAMPEIVVELWL